MNIWMIYMVLCKKIDTMEKLYVFFYVWIKKIKKKLKIFILVDILSKLSLLIPCDSSGVFLVKLIHVYQSKYAKIGSFIKISIRETRPKNFLKKKKKYKSFILRTKIRTLLCDTSWYKSYQNNCVILKKRLQLRGRVVMGYTSYLIKRKKFLKSFVKII